jgi:hypothetical protein
MTDRVLQNSADARDIRLDELTHVSDVERGLSIEEGDANNQYFQNYVFYFSGFDDNSRVNAMRRMVMAGGGMLVSNPLATKATQARPASLTRLL